MKEPFVRRLNETCANYDLRVDRMNYPHSKAGVRRVERFVATYRNSFGSLRAPARYRDVQRMLVDSMRKREQMLAAVRSGDRSGFQTSQLAILAVDGKLDRRYAEIGASTCVVNRKS